MEHVAAALEATLPHDFARNATLVVRAADEGELDGWPAWPLTAWVARAGLDHPEQALDALAALTHHASAEFAVRPFLERDPQLGLARLRSWAASDDAHLRRLASEGSRPRLPWGSRLRAFEDDPTPTLALLDALRDDPEEYVRRSVANHLGDVAKDRPELALEVAQRWQAEGGAHVEWVVRHGLRTLVKRGDPAALALLGANADAPLAVRDLRLAAATVAVGDPLCFSFALHSDADTPVRAIVDYAIGFPLADGRRSPKVFKLATYELAPGGSVAVERRHPMREVTTRVTRSGEHDLAIQVNGRVLAATTFALTR